MNYNNIIELVLSRGNKVNDTLEIVNANLDLPVHSLLTSDQRMMSPYYLAGELIFNLAISNDLKFISHYSKFWNNLSDDGKTVRSAYFWQAFKGHGCNQVEDVIKKLKNDKHSRQAIIHLHHVNCKLTKDEICTLTLQFLIRNDELIMIVNMRSNDIILGLPYDHCLFLMLGNFIAYRLNCKLVKYYHNAGSLHKYDKNKLNVLYNDTVYPIFFSDNFFEFDAKTIVLFERTIRTNVGEVSYDFDQPKFYSVLGKTLAMILLMHKRPDDIKRIIFSKLSGKTSPGLRQLLIDYEMKRGLKL